MPIFMPDGPNIPPNLIHAHEDGRVVLFCGAGISVPAGLPNFKNLTSGIYEKIGESPNTLENDLIKQGQYDRALGLLEERCVDGRESIRKVIYEILTPDENICLNLGTHEALLNLSKDRKGKYRLITTNYDRLFKKTIEKFRINTKEYEAPLLPVCKPNKWDGIVYLHGLLPEKYEPGILQNLIVSSGDFGLGYLTERWASRFVSNLFQNYTVCFVGYSIDDPVLRYMMDALAADRLIGVDTPKAYAFADFSKEDADETRVLEEWRAKGVTPLLYNNKEDYKLLHETLRIWGEAHRDGVNGKKAIVQKFASRKPTEPYSFDHGVSQVLWAIREPHATKFFAELNPPPPFEWIEPLSEKIFSNSDLSLFCAYSRRNSSEKFSILKRPFGFGDGNVIGLVTYESEHIRLDGIMYPIANWLAKFLDDPRLFLWVIKNGAVLNQSFKQIIISSLEKCFDEGNRENLLKKLWDLLLTDKIWTPIVGGELYPLLWDLQKNPFFGRRSKNIILRSIEPCVKVTPGFQYGEDGSFIHGNEIATTVALRSDDAKHAIRDISKISGWSAFLAENILELTSLLKNAFDLLDLIGSSHVRLTTIGIPSIAKHSQNEFSSEWSLIASLLRDSWLEVAKQDKSKGRAIFELWKTIDFSIFRRMELFALKTMNISDSNEAIEYLLHDNGKFLWDVDSWQEVAILLESLTVDVNLSSLEKLETAILSGDPESEKQDNRREFDIWRRLRKIRDILILDSPAYVRLGELDDKFSEYAGDASIDFNSYIEVGYFKEEVKVPRAITELTAWLIGQCEGDKYQRTDWVECCREDFSISLEAIIDAAKNGKWPIAQWNDALICWSNNEYAMQAWEKLLPIFLDMPSTIYAQLGMQISSFLEHIAKEIDHNNEKDSVAFVQLCEKSINANYPLSRDSGNLVHSAINHPLGMAAHALLVYWGRTNLADGVGLDLDVARLFAQILKSNDPQSLSGKLIVGRAAINLFRVDPSWFRKNLFPLFDWNASEDNARYVWAGFLWNPYLYADFLFEIRDFFLETASKLDHLDDSSQYVPFLTYIALESKEIFNIEKLNETFKLIPTKFLRAAIHEIKGAMKSANIPYDEYWKNRVTPFISLIWPKSAEKNPQEVLESIASLCIHAKDAFPCAFNDFRSFLKNFHPTDHYLYVIEHDSMVVDFPFECLEFLRVICKDGSRYYYLKEILDKLTSKEPSIAECEIFKQLSELIV